MGQMHLDNQRLLLALAEELRQPLLQISGQAELAQLQPAQGSFKAIEVAARQAMWFVDGFLLSQQLDAQTELALQPITVGAALEQTAHTLAPLAKQYDFDIDLHLSGRSAPVMAHAEALQAALLGLSSTLLGAAAAQQEGRGRLVLASHSARGGVVAGVFSQAEGLSRVAYRQGRQLYGQAAQSLPQFSAQPSAGVYLADKLLGAMNSRLRVAQHQKLSGLAATLLPSQQLALI